MGSYLAACVFFSYFFGRAAHGLYVAPDVNDSMAAICWDVSWEVVAGVTEQTRTTDTRRSKLTVNPNPCPGGPTVCVDPSLAAGDRLVLYDAAGRVAWSGLMPAGCRRVALPRLHAGCYILRTESGAAAVRLTVVR
jgi:hypothetical protein